MRTDTGTAPVPSDPLGSAARLRVARLDPDVLGARLVHGAVDVVVLTLLVAVPGLATLLAAVLVRTEPVVALLACTVASAAVVVGVLVVWPHHDGGRTAGMRWAGLRVVDRRGDVPSHGALALRALLLPVDAVVGLPLVLMRPDRRRLGDLLAGTQVVRDLGGVVVRPRRPGPAAGNARARRRPAVPS